MDYIKQYLFRQFKTFSLVTTSILLSIFLLMIRMKLTHSFFYLFLVWNLFLAVIPFAITSYLVSIPKLNKITFVLWFSAWLLFLPNAPYIITDFLHLRISDTNLIWLDILVIISFAFNGLIMFFISVLEMQNLLIDFLSKRNTNYAVTNILFLTGFGVYLGRFLRYNSWEILSTPHLLLNDCLNILIQPHNNKEAWLFTILFGIFLNVGYWVFKEIYQNN